MILLYVLRAFFVLAVLAAGWSLIESSEFYSENATALWVGFVVLAFALVLFDVLLPRKSLYAIAGLFFGLVAGLLISYGLSLVMDLLVDVVLPRGDVGTLRAVSVVKILLGVICCYLCVSFVLQTKDDIRFVVPYVEFSKQLKGEHPAILDTSAIIDGRIADIAETGVMDQRMIVPRFVLQELQAVADSTDRMKRSRGRRGLDILNRLQANKQLDIQILDELPPGTNANEPVDQKLVSVTKMLNGRVVTNDYNLNKVAQLRGVTVININDLAKAVRPVVLPGETMPVKVVRAGEEHHQGVGYLEDGTMVVIEGGRHRIGEMVDVVVTSVLQTSAGRMIFGRMDGSGAGDHRRAAGPDATGNA